MYNTTAYAINEDAVSQMTASILAQMGSGRRNKVRFTDATSGRHIETPVFGDEDHMVPPDKDSVFNYLVDMLESRPEAEEVEATVYKGNGTSYRPSTEMPGRYVVRGERFEQQTDNMNMPQQSLQGPQVQAPVSGGNGGAWMQQFYAIQSEAEALRRERVHIDQTIRQLYEQLSAKDDEIRALKVERDRAESDRRRVEGELQNERDRKTIEIERKDYETQNQLSGIKSSNERMDKLFGMIEKGIEQFGQYQMSRNQNAIPEETPDDKLRKGVEGLDPGDTRKKLAQIVLLHPNVTEEDRRWLMHIIAIREHGSEEHKNEIDRIVKAFLEEARQRQQGQQMNDL